MDIIFFSVIIIVVLIGLAIFLSECQKSSLDKTVRPINELNNKYLYELKNWCANNCVYFEENIINTKEVYLNRLLPGYIWFNKKDILFCPDSLNCNNLNISESIVWIKYDSIKYFSKDGTIGYTNEIINCGKNISITGAVIGGLIAGEAGAVIGSRKDMNKIENVTVKHDEVYTYIYYEHKGEIKTINISGIDFYNKLLNQIPEKEYSYIIFDNSSIKNK